MRHLILGMGNLGLDLERALKSKLYDVECRSLSGGFDLVDGAVVKAAVQSSCPDVIWNCVGTGGPKKSDPQEWTQEIELIAGLPQRLRLYKKPETKLVLFSTAYTNRDPEGQLSNYARCKAIMEKQESGKIGVTILRVGSLYGIHKPFNCLPGKIVKLLEGGQLHFPAFINHVTPTPTEWLAKRLVSGKCWEWQKDLCFGPDGSTPVFSWIRDIASAAGLVENWTVEPNGYDPMYPGNASSFCKSELPWETLWQGYGSVVIERARSLSRCR